MKHQASSLTPQQIVQELDKYIIGQQDSKKSLAVAVRNRYRRIQIPQPLRDEIVPPNILMYGPTGSGKTECARRLAKIVKVPFIKVEATKYTERGYVGGDVPSMVRELVYKAYTLVKDEKQQAIIQQAQKAVENILLDILIPPIKPQDKNPDPTQTNPQAPHLNQETRKNFLEKLRNGTLDSQKINLSLEQNPAQIHLLTGGQQDETAMAAWQSMMSRLIPKEKKKRRLTISQAKKLLLEQEKHKLLDLEAIKEEALQRAKYEGIIFIDEMDKIAAPNHKTGPKVSTEGVQRELLTIVEGTTVNTKYGPINTDYILFIASGAFHHSKPSDLIPELQGRFPIRVALQALTQKDFLDILQKTKNSLIKQYQSLFQAEEVTLHFHDPAIEEIAEIAHRVNQNLENIGARRLHTVMSKLLEELLFQMPDQLTPSSQITIDKDFVQKRLHTLLHEKDTQQYIL